MGITVNSILAAFACIANGGMPGRWSCIICEVTVEWNGLCIQQTHGIHMITTKKESSHLNFALGTPFLQPFLLKDLSKSAANVLLSPYFNRRSCQTSRQWMMPVVLRLTPPASKRNHPLGRDSDLPSGSWFMVHRRPLTTHWACKGQVGCAIPLVAPAGRCNAQMNRNKNKYKSNRKLKWNRPPATAAATLLGFPTSVPNIQGKWIG